MNNYVIFTDSCCDVKPEILSDWGVSYADMTFSFVGEDREYINTDISTTSTETIDNENFMIDIVVWNSQVSTASKIYDIQKNAIFAGCIENY